MIRLRCESCGTAFYSAAARTMVERGERCAICGGALRIDEAPPEGPRIGVVADGDDHGEE